MKKTLILLWLIVITVLVFGQTGAVDVVYLKNGSIIRGLIIEEVPNISIKIRSEDKSVFNIPINEIEKFTKEYEVEKTGDSSVKFIQNGYQNITELGILVGMGMIQSTAYFGKSYPNDVIDFSVSTINGWLINSYVFTGFGVAVEKENSNYRVPLFIDTRFFVTKSRVTPFISTDIGYALQWNKERKGSYWGGSMIGVGAGVLFHTTKSTSLLFSFGYKLQLLKLEWPGSVYYPHNIEYENSYSNLLMIKVGISF